VENETLFCAFNLSADAQTLELPGGVWQAIEKDLGSAAIEDSQVMLGPWGFCLATQA
jgi:alpha-glucosidase